MGEVCPMDTDMEQRLKRLEDAALQKQRLVKIADITTWLTAFILHELALIGLLVWSVAHLVAFVRGLF